MMGFKNKVVIVTGGSSGIGAATAIKFSEQGANVVIVGRNEVKLKQTSDKCAAYGKKPLTIVADVTKDDDVKKIVRATIEEFSKIDVLINNAGIVGKAGIDDDNALEVFDRLMTTNLRSVVLLTNLSAKHLMKTKGNIINISSIAAIDVLTRKHFAYCTSKAGLDHFTRSVALDLSSKGVRVNSVNPGPVETDIFEGYGVDNSKIQDFIKNLEKMTALGRISTPDEIADLVLFVASDKAKAITGSKFVTDNGVLLKRDFNIAEDL